MNKVRKPVIVVHGGAGTWHSENSRQGLRGVKEAARIGFGILKCDGRAVDSVVEAVAVMEDDATFNAGYGSSLNIEKDIEMEASLMDGRTLQAGAVGLLRDIKNPIRLAKIIMEKTDHVLVVGEGAERLAEIHELERIDPTTEFRVKCYERYRKTLLEGEYRLPRLADLLEKHGELFDFETVGAAAIDKDGHVAAATSTGGFALKLPGRIGDSPSIGCGTYADNRVGACSATGIGEIAMRLVLAKAVCDSMEKKTAQQAVDLAVSLVNQRISDTYNSIGLIAVDANGRIGAAHNSPNLCWAYATPEMQEPLAALEARTIK